MSSVIWYRKSGVGFFSNICYEYTDISNKEQQLRICSRWVDKELEAHEDLFGFCNVTQTLGSETIVSAIKDVLLKLQLSLDNYDGASNMMGPKTGVAKIIQDLQPKVYPTHCH